MSRLFDDMQRDPTLLTLRQLSKLTPPIVVDISNVATYWALHKKGTWDIATDFPTLMPPFETAFYEWRVPRHVRSGSDIIELDGTTNIRYGLLVHTIPPEHMETFAATVAPSNAVVLQREFHDMLRTLASKTHSMSLCYGFLQDAGGRIYEIFQTAIGMDEQGKQVRFSETTSHPILLFRYTNDPTEHDDSLNMVAGFLNPMYLAVNFLHCKNVKRIPNIPSDKLQRRRAKDGKPPMTRFYTLQIEPMKEVLRREGGADTVGLQRALHICRGSFATYTPDKPLFGKVAGTFYRPEHVRGALDAGEIVKDYKIKLPDLDE